MKPALEAASRPRITSVARGGDERKCLPIRRRRRPLRRARRARGAVRGAGPQSDSLGLGGAAYRRRGSQRGDDVVAVHARDERDADLLGARGLALVVVRAPAEAEVLVLLHHLEDARGSLGLALRQEAEVADLRAHEEARARVRAGGDARATADA